MSPPVPRYLVPFHPKHVPHFFTDVLVVGSGLAGLRAALAVEPGLSVVVTTKQPAEQSNSNLCPHPSRDTWCRSIRSTSRTSSPTCWSWGAGWPG